jgi:hypothetical protein
LLSSYSVTSTNNPAFSYNPDRASVAETSCQLPPIKTTRKLLKQFQQWGMDIFLITGRSESERAGAISCLNSVGIAAGASAIANPEE